MFSIMYNEIFTMLFFKSLASEIDWAIWLVQGNQNLSTSNHRDRVSTGMQLGVKTERKTVGEWSHWLSKSVQQPGHELAAKTLWNIRSLPNKTVQIKVRPLLILVKNK